MSMLDHLVNRRQKGNSSQELPRGPAPFETPVDDNADADQAIQTLGQYPISSNSLPDGAGCSATPQAVSDELDSPVTPATQMTEALLNPSSPVSQNLRDMRTRLVGFDRSDSSTRDLFSAEDQPASDNAALPVGWLVIIDGPGYGHAFTLYSGLSNIGRNPDQTVCLDFGDMAISRDNHAAIAFDPEQQMFLLGHGGKTNLVRLQGKPIISNEQLNDGDQISIGETKMLFKALCGDSFNWARESDDDDVFDTL
ncbi:FHA domain-containing protein [uncultured Ruegeria sp.]|uniref:FHA domain-containing protein n=1 Tax=uncultured Ruegeria sp. TaxID=259304 RepID=UPI0026330727|nr:FHA domain-containing protein [uncultured Ruegeria sp.]